MGFHCIGPRPAVRVASATPLASILNLAAAGAGAQGFKPLASFTKGEIQLTEVAMNTRTGLRSLAVLAVFALIACNQGSTQQPATPADEAAASPTSSAPASNARGATARTAFAKARERAVAWQPDARLEKVMTIYAQKDGKVSGETVLGMFFPWEFIFSSASANKAWTVDTNGAEVRENEATGWMLFNPISEAFVDSDVAMAEAARNGYEPDDGNHMELVVQFGSEKLPEPMWVIGQLGHTHYAISASTGKFVRKLTS